MSGRALSSEYSRYLYVLGKEQINPVCSFFEAFTKALHENRDFVRFIHHPAISIVEKVEIAEKLFGVIPQGCKSVLREILLKRKVAHIPDISLRLSEIRNAESGHLLVNVQSALELSEAQKQLLTDSLSKTFSKVVVADYSVKPSLLAGVRLKIGNTIYDNTIRNQLNSITENLHSQSRG